MPQLEGESIWMLRGVAFSAHHPQRLAVQGGAVGSYQRPGFLPHMAISAEQVRR